VRRVKLNVADAPVEVNPKGEIGLKVHQINENVNTLWNKFAAFLDEPCCVQTTDDLRQGIKNLYYSDALVQKYLLSGKAIIKTGSLTLLGVTLGSVLFVGAGGVITEDNANFFWDNANNRLGLGIAAPTGALDVSWGSAATSALVMGADLGANTSRTNVTRKWATVSTPHYTNAEEQVEVLTVDSNVTTSIIGIGGGENTYNAATMVRFFTAANNTTTTGTERFRITPTGTVGIGTIAPLGALDVSWGSSATSALVVGADIGGNSSRTNVTRKFAVVSAPHYTNAEEQLLLMSADCNVTTNIIGIGGGEALYNSATLIRFYTAANNTTVTGTLRMSIDDDGVVSTASGRIVNTTRTVANPYNILVTDHVIACDTDGNVIVANLPVGINGTHYIVKNVGSSGNNLTLTPNGAETIDGAVSLVLTDGQCAEVVFETTENWMIV